MSEYLLVVDQDSLTRLNIQQTLQKGGFEVLAGVSGDECIRLSFSDKRPCLIILGWNMPVLNGLEILTLLKLNVRSRNIPVIMTGGEQSFEEQALKAGAAAFLTKPIKSEELLHHVRRALGLD